MQQTEDDTDEEETQEPMLTWKDAVLGLLVALLITVVFFVLAEN